MCVCMLWHSDRLPRLQLQCPATHIGVLFQTQQCLDHRPVPAKAGSVQRSGAILRGRGSGGVRKTLEGVSASWLRTIQVSDRTGTVQRGGAALGEERKGTATVWLSSRYGWAGQEEGPYASEDGHAHMAQEALLKDATSGEAAGRMTRAK